jgi:hypothetical protein
VNVDIYMREIKASHGYDEVFFLPCHHSSTTKRKEKKEKEERPMTLQIDTVAVKIIYPTPERILLDLYFNDTRNYKPLLSTKLYPLILSMYVQNLILLY